MRRRINEQLAQKYDNPFHFFQVKAINEMIFDQTTRISNMIFKDLTVFVDINQYLKRQYYFSNSSNRNQIVQRIKMLTQFYQQNLVLRYEYPMMIITKNKNVFMKRLRRLKKMTAMEDSSDVSSSKSVQVDFSINSTNFLKSVDSQYSSHSENKKRIQDQKQAQDSNQAFTIYESSNLQQNEKTESFNLKIIEGQTVSTFISDFDQVDVQQAIVIYQKANKQLNKKKQIKCLEEKKQKKGSKQISSSIVITPIDFIDLKAAKTINNGFGSPKKLNMNEQMNIKNKYYSQIPTIEDTFTPSINSYRRKPIYEYEHQMQRLKKQDFKSTSPVNYFQGQSKIYDHHRFNENNRIKAIKEKAVALLNGGKNHQNFKYQKYHPPRYY